MPPVYECLRNARRIIHILCGTRVSIFTVRKAHDNVVGSCDCNNFITRYRVRVQCRKENTNVEFVFITRAFLLLVKRLLRLFIRFHRADEKRRRRRINLKTYSDAVDIKTLSDDNRVELCRVSPPPCHTCSRAFFFTSRFSAVTTKSRDGGPKFSFGGSRPRGRLTTTVFKCFYRQTGERLRRRFFSSAYSRTPPPPTNNPFCRPTIEIRVHQDAKGVR